MQEFARKFYKSKAWQACRAAYIAQRVQEDGGLCQCCGEEPGYIVHHVVHLTPANINDPAVALNPANLAYECKACHDLHEGHGVGKGKNPLARFGPDGQPVDLRRI